MSPVDSSWIKSIGHHPASNTLRVELHTGAVYHYAGVDAKKHEALIGAESIGSHLNAHIKGRHEHIRVDA